MARKKQETLVLFPEVAESTKKMTDAQFGALMRAVFAYRFTGEVYDGDDVTVDIVFRIVAGQVDRYREVCETNRDNARSASASAEETQVQRNAAESGEIPGNAPPNPIPIPYPNPDPIPVPDPNNGSGAAKPPTRTRFAPPKVNEVRKFCQENGYTDLDPERFVNFYQSKGWKVGRDPMKDWKAAVRGWNSRDKPEPKKPILNYEEGENWTL